MKTNKLAGGGITTALCTLMLLIASIVPNVKLSLLFASSIAMAICLLRYKTSSYLISFLAVSLLSLFIAPNKFLPLAFLAFFGNYPLVKLYIEKIKNIYLEYFIKFIAANIYLFAIYIILKALGEASFFDFSLIVLYIVGIVMMLFYDLAFSFIINAFYKTYYKHLK